MLVQIESLRKNYELTVCGYTDPSVEGVQFVPFDPDFNSLVHKLAILGPGIVARELFFRFGLFRRSYFADKKIRLILQKVQASCFDAILCNDVDMLPLSARLKKLWNAKLYLDAHEYTPRQWDGDPSFRRWIPYWTSLLVEFAPSVDLMTTVCQSIADEYHREFKLACANIVYNLPSSAPGLVPSPVADDHIRLIHHGGLNRNRGPESMIDLVEHLDPRFSLTFMFVDNDPEYLNTLRTRARGNPRISFVDPVATSQIASRINEFDIGLFMLDPTSFNYRNALPNKFFEFIQARLAIAIWPSHEMKGITEKHNLGVVASEFTVESLAKELNSLSAASVRIFKNNSNRVAPKLVSATSIDRIRKNMASLLS